MAIKKYNDVRIQLKRDTAANWELNNPVLLNGEEIIVDTNAGEVRRKIGDGTKNYTQLPFTDEVLRTQISNRVEKVYGKGLSTNDYTTSEKNKLAGLSNYTHPSLPAQSSDFYKFSVSNEGHVNTVTKVTKEDITKLGIPAQDTVYTHPATHAPSIIAQDADNRFVTDVQIAAWNNKASNISFTEHIEAENPHGITKTTVGLGNVENKSSATIRGEITKDNVVAALGYTPIETVTGYTHPATHPATMITEDSSHKFVTDAQINTWNAKASTTVASTTANGLMSTTMVTKLNGIAEGANNYVHPATHAATIITEDSTHRFVSDTEKATWNAKLEKSELTTHTNNKSNPHGVTKTQIGLENVTNDAQVKRSEMGTASGVATLDSNGKILFSQLPSYVDDVVDGYYYNSKFYKEAAHTTEITGEASKIYIDLDTNKTYRWSGTAFAIISDTLALGETSSTAYAGNKGKANADAIAVIQTKLNGIANGANNYVHPATHPATMITEDSSHKFVTDAQITAWNGKASTTVATTTANGLMSSTDKAKLDGIATNANNYSHPTYTQKASGLYKITVDNTGHISATAAVAKSDITGLGIPAQDTTYGVASTTANGLMSSTDKTNLEALLTKVSDIEAKLQNAVFYR